MVKTIIDDKAVRYGAEPGGASTPVKAKITYIDSHGQARTVEGEIGLHRHGDRAPQ